MSINLLTAQSIITEALATGQQHGFKPLTVVVLDSGGHTIAAAREDGASNNRFEIAHGKAYGALALGVGSRALMERAEQQAYFIAAATAALGGRLIPVPGGVLVRTGGGTIAGAVGVSGDSSDNDETAAKKAIEAAGLTAQVA
ncbi:heme-binding protein [Paenarthrobacter sp. Z7-10]|uniref:GlcG/HbpS family heme-binding protein n=1 Tax=Paenarthrobacter sp. Z7-10 TaxID=2787635 RepID=UPI0022A95A2C|nr:heme-binding protein [Paenarthrobacter sp. Z7-10]MCZ2403975.1 heme-binding protein [Paenarthrobacter sp. Z7-10]